MIIQFGVLIINRIMKNLRLKILLLLSLLSTGLIVYSWIQNTYQIDFFATKNRHLRIQMIQELKENNDIDSVKVKAIQIVENIGQNANKDSKRAIKESKIQIGIFCLLLIVNVLIIIEIRNKNATQ